MIDLPVFFQLIPQSRWSVQNRKPRPRLWGHLLEISCTGPLVMADTVGRAAAPLSHPSRHQGWTAVAGTHSVAWGMQVATDQLQGRLVPY